jgi:hypothetical protein
MKSKLYFGIIVMLFYKEIVKARYEDALYIHGKMRGWNPVYRIYNGPLSKNQGT